MLLGPHDIARRLQHQHSPGWSIWYGTQTRQYWAVASWPGAPRGMFGADTPEALEAAITTFETLHTQPRQYERPPERIQVIGLPAETKVAPLARHRRSHRVRSRSTGEPF